MAPVTHRPKSRNTNNTTTTTSIPIKVQSKNANQTSRAMKRKIGNNIEIPTKKPAPPNIPESISNFAKKRASYPNTTPD